MELLQEVNTVGASGYMENKAICSSPLQMPPKRLQRERRGKTFGTRRAEGITTAANVRQEDHGWGQMGTGGTRAKAEEP